MRCDVGCEIERIEGFIRHVFWSSGTKKIVLGVSGGIDSAIAAALCAQAVGNERVIGITLPTSVTSEKDVSDAVELCDRLDITQKIVSIDPMIDAFGTIPDFEASTYIVGNLMARVRMAALYYYANAYDALVCGTSNKSEYLLGYCTKYGDNAADFQPILHLYKTEVYTLACEFPLPDAIITKPPSAGLWYGQSDEMDLGFSYEDIDEALQVLEENGWKSTSGIEHAILQRVRTNRHKRVAPPSLLTSNSGCQ